MTSPPCIVTMLNRGLTDTAFPSPGLGSVPQSSSSRSGHRTYTHGMIRRPPDHPEVVHDNRVVGNKESMTLNRPDSLPLEQIPTSAATWRTIRRSTAALVAAGLLTALAGPAMAQEPATGSGCGLEVSAPDISDTDADLTRVSHEVVVAVTSGQGVDICSLRAPSQGTARQIAEQLDAQPGVVAEVNRATHLEQPSPGAQADSSAPNPYAGSRWEPVSGRCPSCMRRRHGRSLMAMGSGSRSLTPVWI